MSDYVEQILEELCDASDDCVWAELRGVGDDEKNAIKNFQDTWDNAVEKLTKPTISDYLEVNKEMIDKTGCKVVTIASLREFGGLGVSSEFDFNAIDSQFNYEELTNEAMEIIDSEIGDRSKVEDVVFRMIAAGYRREFK